MSARNGRRPLMVVAALVLVALLVAVPALSDGIAGSRLPLVQLLRGLLTPNAGERTDGCYRLVDEAGNVLLETARYVSRGTLFIDPANITHRVVRVRGDVAETVQVDADAAMVGAELLSSPLPARIADMPATTVGPGAIPLGTARQVIVVYHTHSDESYLPTDGATAIRGNGGIYDVGEELAASLSAAGFTVVYDRAAHDPHDAGAYPRSRRTVLRNLQFGPTLLYDVHRDASPAEVYTTEIDGVKTSRVLLVVGGGNPLSGANLALARRMKTAADELYPTLVRGILVARGNYNQDLDPGAMLLEMGTAWIPKEWAVRAADLWADVTAALLGPPGPDATPADPTPPAD